MKKIFTTAVILWGILLLSTANAQSIGVKGGLNFANLSNYNSDTRVSGNIGLYLHAPLEEGWSIQPELLFSGQGARYSTINGERTLALDYIQIPVMFQYSPVRKFYVELGPQIGFLTNAAVKDDSGDKVNVNSDYNKTDFGINIGAGINATRAIGFFARYDFGLTDVTRNDNQTYRNEVGQIGMYLRLTP